MVAIKLFYYLSRIDAFLEQHRLFSTFFLVAILVVGGDIIFANYLFEPYSDIIEYLFNIRPGQIPNLDLGSAAESWLALLATVLGTLIIVISIASQSIPKLIDMYMQDRTSLFYVWLLIISGAHGILIKMYGEIGLEHSTSRLYNTHFLLPICMVAAFPYIFYILRYTKPINVINRISRGQLAHIQALAYRRIRVLMDIPTMVEEYQFMLFDALNQLDDLLEYVSFKEPKADILQDMTYTIQEYIHLKSEINPVFFKVSQKIRSDISFKTMIGQFGEMERARIFYEQKCFRLLGNIYIKLIEQGEFDLASLCASQMTLVGITALEVGDDDLLDLIIVRFNTYLRFAIKHGAKNNEARNLYTTGFHYGSFVERLVRHKKVDLVKRCFMYFRMYGVEIFKHGKSSPAMYFIVDVFAAEMKKSLILIYEEQWDTEIQEGLVKEMLMVDSPPDFNKEDLDRGILMNNGVRVLQIGLALFYLREGRENFVQKIIKDVLDDLKVLGESTYRQVINGTCARLQFSGPTFWEDTDRGNLNIYYTSDQSQIEPFKALMEEELHVTLIRGISKVYTLEPIEAELAWEMSRLTEVKEVFAVCQQPIVFEKALHHLETIDEERLQALVSLRNKVKFTSENLDLTISSTRQIAVHTPLEVIYQKEGSLHTMRHKVRVIFNYPNFLYVQFPPNFDGLKQLQTGKSLTFQFQSLRKNLVYQFQSSFEGEPVDGLIKVVHRETVKIASAA